jgi:diaminopimelate decarboxylase
MSTEYLFPITAKANAADHLELGGCDLVDLAREFGTPLYVFDEATLIAQAEQARDAFRARWPDSLVLYATKAYFAPFLARLFLALGLGLDVTSEAEMEIARREGFRGDTIYVHGNNKTAAEIRTAFEVGIEHLVVDNIQEIPIIAALAQSCGRTARLLLRLSPDIDPRTHRFLKTGTADSKFGLAIEGGQTARAFDEIYRYPSLKLAGLHVHIGSQVFEVEALVQAMVRCVDLAAEWFAQHGFELQELSLGGGWGVAYTEGQESLSVPSLADKLCSTLRASLEERNLSSNLRLLVEPGRALVARAGVALYRIGSIKSRIPMGQVSDARIYAAIDGGMGDNIRPALYEARYTARVANKWDAPAAQSYAIAGRYCEQGDVLIDAVPLPQLERGDLLAVPNAGAYQLPMASNYNLIPRPAVVLVKDGKASLVRRRETIDDMLACDLA